MSTLREHAFNIFVIDGQDEPIPGAVVEVLLGPQPVARATTRRRSDPDGVIRGVPNAPVSVHLPDEITDVRIRVSHEGETQEQPVDLDAPNLTFRLHAAEPRVDRDAAPPAGSLPLTTLRERIVREFSRSDLVLLCQDIEASGRLDDQPFSFDALPEGGKELQASELVGYFDRRGKLPVLLTSIERVRPGFAARLKTPERFRGVVEKGGPEAPPAPAARPVSVTPRIRLSEVPTAIYDLLLREKRPLVSVDMLNQRDTSFAGSLSVEVKRYSDEESRDVDLPARKQDTVDLHPVLDPSRIRALEEIERVTLLVRLDGIDNQTVSKQTASLYLLPRSVAPLSVKDLMTGDWQDLRPYLAGYVTPNAGVVQGFLGNVARAAAGQPLVGYGGRPADVEPQVRAVFEALKAHGVAYVSSTLVFNRHIDWSQQRLRLPRETLALKVANCLDGAVLVASLLEAFGLNAALVFTGTGDNAHAFVGWETMNGSDDWRHVETNAFTTMTFEEARSSADGKAAAYAGESPAAGSIFRRLPIKALHAQGIFPLE